MSDLIGPILDLASETSQQARGLGFGSKQARAKSQNELRNCLADLTRQCDFLKVAGPPALCAELPYALRQEVSSFRLEDCREPRLWQWQVNRALNDLLAAVKEQVEATLAAPLCPETADPDDMARYNALENAALAACQAAEGLVEDARRRLECLRQLIDRRPAATPATPAEAPSPSTPPPPPPPPEDRPRWDRANRQLLLASISTLPN